MADLEASACLPADDGSVPIVVVGAHLSGMPLNHELTSSRWIPTENTAERLVITVSLRCREPSRPNRDWCVTRVFRGRAWRSRSGRYHPKPSAASSRKSRSTRHLARFRWMTALVVSGFLCEAHAVVDALDITDFGGWRRYVHAKAENSIVRKAG